MVVMMVLVMLVTRIVMVMASPMILKSCMGLILTMPVMRWRIVMAMA